MKLLKTIQVGEDLFALAREMLSHKTALEDIQNTLSELEPAFWNEVKKRYDLTDEGKYRITYNFLEGMIEWYDTEEGPEDKEEGLLSAPGVGTLRGYYIEIDDEMWIIGANGKIEPVTDMDELNLMRGINAVVGITQMGLYNMSGRWLKPILKSAIAYEKLLRKLEVRESESTVEKVPAEKEGEHGRKEVCQGGL